VHRVEGEEVQQAFPAIRHGEHLVWGLTHRILTGFLEIAARVGV
jgi:hypothetical protein